MSAQEGVVERLAELPIEEDDDDEDIDETVSERLWGLTEMFPSSVRSICGVLSDVTFLGTKLGFSLGRNVLWIAATSASIMFLPIMFESERAKEQEQQLQQQRQILLGPNAAVSGGQGQNLLPGVYPPGMMVQGGAK